MKRVLVFGTFDLLHPGHISFLSNAAKHGAVTVVVTPDAKVSMEKGRVPHFSERERLEMVAALKSVNSAIIGDRSKRWTVVRRIAPDVICVGHDQNTKHPAFLAQLAKLKKQPKIVRLGPFRPNLYSSSKVKLEIHRRHSKKPSK